jgi:hypothetical protein
MESVKINGGVQRQAFTSAGGHGRNTAGESPETELNMSVAIYVVLTIALFAVFGLVQKAVERL